MEGRRFPQHDHSSTAAIGGYSGPNARGPYFRFGWRSRYPSGRPTSASGAKIIPWTAYGGCASRNSSLYSRAITAICNRFGAPLRSVLPSRASPHKTLKNSSVSSAGYVRQFTRVRASLLTLAATLGQALGDFKASRLTNDESMELFRRLGDEDGLYFAMGTAGLIALGQGKPNEAISMMEESGERRLEGMGDKWAASAMFGFSATVALGQGDCARARRLAERALSLARDIGAREAIAVALPTLAVTARDDGDREQAAALFAEGLTLSAQVGDRTNIAYYLEGLAEISASENRLERAARLWGATGALLETIAV